MTESPAPTERPALPALPVKSIDEALPLLRRPFAPGAVRWKVQATWPKGKAEGAVVIGYIDARLVSARLNKVVGGNWSEKPIRVEGQGNALMYELTVFEQTHIDIGIGQGRDTEMKLKAVHSDALKRPAVRFGIGESLYAMPQFILQVTDDGAETSDGAPTIKRRKDGKAGNLRENHEAFLRKKYEEWLRVEGAEAFGAPLDHGDAATGSVGEAVVADEDAPEASPTEPLDDDRAKELGEQARKLRDEIREVDDDALAQQSFDNAMAQREHSHERLEDFVGNLEELRANVIAFRDLSALLATKLDEGDLKTVVDRAKRRASRAERVQVLQEALDAAGQEGGGDGGE